MNLKNISINNIVNMYYQKIVLFLSFFFLLCTSCTTISSIGDVSEERGYEEIKKEYEKKDWDAVTRDVGDFRIRYPYSKYSAELELLQANSYFKTVDYPTAVVTYEDFIRRNPYDPNLPFAYFRIAESYDRDSSKEEDRDQTNTQKALNKYKEFLEKFPKSDYSENAQERIDILSKRLAEHAMFIATYYWNQNAYAAALMRYIFILDNFSQFPDMVKIARKNGSFCYKKLASILEKNPKSDEFIFFKNETPQGLREKAKIIAGEVNESN